MMIKPGLRSVYYRWLAWRERYRPQLGLAAILRHCGRSLPLPLIQRRGDSAAQAEVLAKAFRYRPNAKHFFMPLQELGNLARKMPVTNPDWVTRTLKQVRRDTEIAMTCYCRQLPPLNDAFPWGEIEPGIGGDRIYSFRPQRFAFAPRLALALHYDASLSGRLAEILCSWINFAKEDGSDIAYATKLVVTQRFVASSWSWAWLAARPAEQLDEEDWQLEAMILRILFSDARFLLKSVGNEFPNNHLLADWFIAWYVEFLFPEFLLPHEHQRDHEQGWLSELKRQIYEDGCSFEHSVHYHEFATELIVAYFLLLRSNGRTIPKWVEGRAHRMLRFQADIHGNQADAFSLGNTTEDPMFPLDTAESWSIGGNRELLRALFEPDLVPAAADDPSVERAFWLLGGKLARAPVHSVTEPALRQYPKGGFHIFFDQGEELVFRTGPAPGVVLCAGHMHADLLSIYLRLDDKPVLVEAGTYTYLITTSESMTRWRGYFMGPAAHNGLSIDGEDPLEPVEQSYRSRELVTRVRLTHSRTLAGFAWVEGEVNSDNHYNGHRRGVIRIEGNYWLVYDRYPDGTESRGAWTSFQLATDADVELSEANLVRIDAGGARVWVSSVGDGPRVLTGSQEPLAGWISKTYGVLEAAPQLRYPVTGPHSAWLLATVLTDQAPFRIEALEATAQGLAIRAGSAGTIDYLFISASPGGGVTEIAAWDIDFIGRLLWLRESTTGPSHLSLIDGWRLTCKRRGIAMQAKVDVADLSLRADERALQVEAGDIDDWQECQWQGVDLA